VAFADTDVAPHPEWLRELVAPLADPRVGATTGNRWYVPPVGRWGSLVRSLWNVSVVVGMYFWHLPWGGSLAIRADVLRRSTLRQVWSRAGCEDVPLYRVLRESGLRLIFVPEILLVDRGECGIIAGLRFMTRQFLWVRLYHPVCWWTSATFHILEVGIEAAAVVLA